jgi:hypothetical protein
LVDDQSSNPGLKNELLENKVKLGDTSLIAAIFLNKFYGEM